jgi:glyoxylate reductase
MAVPKVFVSAPLPGNALARLALKAQVVVAKTGTGLRDPLFEEAADTYDGVIALLTDRVSASLLARATNLRVVANVAVGIDNVDLAACAARGIVVTNTPGVLTETTADLAFALLLAAARRVAEGDRMIRHGQFTGWTPTLLVGARVHGMTLGIVGLGRIGQAMARRARGFGMRLLYTQQRPHPPEIERALGAHWVPLDALIEESDFVSLHCPLTPETKHIINAKRLARMRPGSVLVNTARGGCVDEGALAAALEKGPLGGAGLDVFEGEPLVNPALAALSNVILTPHIGSADRTTRESMATMAVENVIAVLTGRAAPNAVTADGSA